MFCIQDEHLFLLQFLINKTLTQVKLLCKIHGKYQVNDIGFVDSVATIQWQNNYSTENTRRNTKMEPKYRYFKCSLDVDPIKTLDEDWRQKREERDAKLVPILDGIPFYEFWSGDEDNIWGIACHKDNPEFLKIAEDSKTYGVANVKNDMKVIVGNNRSKAGRAFNETIGGIRNILQEYPSYNRFMLRKLGLNCSVDRNQIQFVSVCGVAENYFLVAIPVKSEGFGGKEFPSIPDYLTEIKQSEYLAIQGE